MSVATPPGNSCAAAIASAASCAAPAEVRDSRTQRETGRASDAMSEVSGASASRCQVA